MRSRSITGISAALAAMFVAACASTYQPVVDMQGVDTYKYQQDLSACRQYAEQVNPWESAGIDTLIGAAGGAALGAATGAVVGSPAMGAATGAAVGGIGGGAYGGLSGADRQKAIISNCLKGRGYKVLG
ncbi:MAG: glycine zipper domain-containing protein [Alphaproteobacteria bacterium]|nr:glycine zipper domain-containing protein [Alphaproteobacteria bacterium]